jgi:GDP-L-fucose synthase
VTIAELAGLVRETVGYRGELFFDAAKPDGTPRKLLDTTKLERLGWTPRIPLPEGLGQVHRWFLAHSAELRGFREPAPSATRHTELRASA